MPRQVNVGTPPASTSQILKFTQFKGVDLTNSPIHVSTSRSPDAPNIMPDANGFPVKRPGYMTVRQYDGKINGAYVFDFEGVRKMLVHAGTKLYDDETEAVLYEGMNNEQSRAVQLNGKLWILDGKTYLYYDGEVCAPVSDIATVPVITIAKAPNGEHGATSYKPINLLTGKRTDSFIVKEEQKTETVFVLSFNELAATAVTAQVMTEIDLWVDKVEGTDFTVDRTAGKVTFNTAPGKTPLTGEDNVTITYETVANGADKINKCRFSILYGVNGALDRIFVSGNPDEPNVDYWSEFSDPAYMGDMFYGLLGQESSPIMGYSVLEDKLVTHKQGEENERNAFVRAGSLDDEGFAIFPIVNVLQGEGAVANGSFASLNGEPMFLTARGVYAFTVNDYTNRQYAQGRSRYIDGGLLKKQHLKDSVCIVWGRFYVLAVDDFVYLLDGEQKSYEPKSPLSTYQYECYYWTGINATCLWVEGETLFFGTADGRVCEFGKAGYSGQHKDDNKPVECYWTTPLLTFDTSGRYKTVTNVWVTVQPYSKSDGEIYFATDREYAQFVKDYAVDFFNFDDVDFDRWTFETLDRPRIVPTRKKAKKVKMFQLWVMNNKPTPFGIFSIEIEYRTGGKIRR